MNLFHMESSDSKGRGKMTSYQGVRLLTDAAVIGQKLGPPCRFLKYIQFLPASGFVSF